MTRLPEGVSTRVSSADQTWGCLRERQREGGRGPRALPIPDHHVCARENPQLRACSLAWILLGSTKACPERSQIRTGGGPLRTPRIPRDLCPTSGTLWGERPKEPPGRSLTTFLTSGGAPTLPRPEGFLESLTRLFLP